MLNLLDDSERLQLIMALDARLRMFDEIQPHIWNGHLDRQGNYDQARSAVVRLKQRAKQIKPIKNEQEEKR